jgi:cobalt-zinc-cadmium efflux system membrane fusion protein
MKYIIPIILLAISFLAGSCKSSQEEELNTSEAKSFCLTDTLKAQLETTPVAKQTVESEMVMTGKVTFNEDNVVRVFPLAGGFVKELHAELGDYVKKGQTLAIIRSPEIADFNNQKVAAVSNLRVAEKNYQVAQDLYKTGTISEVELINAQKELETAKGEIVRIDEVLSMYGAAAQSLYPIKSPTSGFVVAKNISLNMEIRTEDISPVFTISDLSNVWVLANVYESDISEVKEGYEAEITTIAYPNKIIKGKIDKIFNQIDPESKVLKARITLSNPNFELKPEMFANVVIRYKEGEEKLAIPSKSVIFDKNRNFVMVYKADCQIETREVKIYQASPQFTYIVGGVEEGEKVMTRHQLLVYDALND